MLLSAEFWCASSILQLSRQYKYTLPRIFTAFRIFRFLWFYFAFYKLMQKPTYVKKISYYKAGNVDLHFLLKRD